MTIEQTKFYKFCEKFCKENNVEWTKSRMSFFHSNEIPFDSVDRIYALYLIDIKSHLLDINIDDVLNKEGNQNDEYMYQLMTEEEKEEFSLVSEWAYENYEREGMPRWVAFFNIINVAQKGKEAVLKDSYYNDGWFGAS
jgi:hypothetical protein